MSRDSQCSLQKLSLEVISDYWRCRITALEVMVRRVVAMHVKMRTLVPHTSLKVEQTVRANDTRNINCRHCQEIVQRDESTAIENASPS